MGSDSTVKPKIREPYGSLELVQIMLREETEGELIDIPSLTDLLGQYVEMGLKKLVFSPPQLTPVADALHEDQAPRGDDDD